MIQTINPYSSARTAEIMSRYRPIAPKPDSLPPPDSDTASVPNGITKSPYLRNVWAHLQARPTRTRKRGRSAAFSPPTSLKRIRTALSPPPGMQRFSLAQNFAPLKCGLDTAVATLAESVALPLIRGIDLNMRAEHAPPRELELLPQNPVKGGVISPRPVRPVGSSILVSNVREEAGREAVEEEAVEATSEPAIVSDSNNRVRMSNAAYKEMVGQPECCWLDCAAGKRIGGEVSLRFVESEAEVAMAAAGFRCAVKIEWESEGKKMSVKAACSAVRLAACEGKDYRFLWRFYTNPADN